MKHPKKDDDEIPIAAARRLIDDLAVFTTLLSGWSCGQRQRIPNGDRAEYDIRDLRFEHGPGTLATGAAPEYPEELAGTSVTFTPVAGGEAIKTRMVYTSAGQLAGLLPSSVTPGDYAVRVIYNGQSSPPQTVTVVARSFGIVTSNSQGFGPAQATIGNVNEGLSLVASRPAASPLGG